jgi:hypothetical protein
VEILTKVAKSVADRLTGYRFFNAISVFLSFLVLRYGRKDEKYSQTEVNHPPKNESFYLFAIEISRERAVCKLRTILFPENETELNRSNSLKFLNVDNSSQTLTNMAL